MGDSWRGDTHRRDNDYDYDYDRRPPLDRYGSGYDLPPRGYSFGGTAQPDNHRTQNDSYRPTEQRPPDFNFRASGPAAPRFPPAAPGQYSQQASQRRERRGNDRGGRGGARGRGRGGRSRAAHARDLISRNHRGATPEQMEGMNDQGKAHFVDCPTSDEDEDAASTGGDSNEQPSTKRMKTQLTKVEASAAPKWSNPDPYTVLPPTDMSMGPKKDIVQTIRKAKVEAADKARGANAIKENIDFISFDDFNDDAMDEPHTELSEDGEIEDSGGVDLGFDITPQFDRNPSVGAAPPPPQDVSMPYSREMNMLPHEYFRAQQPTAPQNAQVSTMVSNKRKRVPEPPSSSAGVIVQEWVSDGSNPTPWLREDAPFTSHVGLQLHKELVDFHEFVRPYSFEAECRDELIDRIQHAVRSWRGSRDIEVRSFGSFASGLYLPTADMDLVAVSPGYIRSGQKSFCQRKKEMYHLANHLGKIAKKNTMVVIPKAKVPILKFVDERTDLKVDISFENDSGLRAIDTFLEWKRDYPEAPQLVVIVKQLLAMRGLNEVHSGGIGGFTIICLVVSMLQLMPQEQSRSGNAQGRLGELLLNFLDLYGNKFDRHTTGITMDPPGYFNKQKDYCAAKINPVGLTIIDPGRCDNDISGGSKQVETVFKCFRGALGMIQHRLDAISKGESDEKSILGCVLGGNYSSFIQQREILRKCADRRQSQPNRDTKDALLAAPQLLRQPVATSHQRNAVDRVPGSAVQAQQPYPFPTAAAAPRLTATYSRPTPAEHPEEYLPRIHPWELTNRHAPFPATERYWMEVYEQSNFLQAPSYRPPPPAARPPPAASRPPPLRARGQAQPPHHTLPPRPSRPQAYESHEAYNSQQNAFAPQPANHMRHPEDDEYRPPAYSNYHPPPSHGRSVENGYSGSKYPTRSQVASRPTNPSPGLSEPKKRKGRAKNKDSDTGLRGDPIDLT